MIKKTQVVNKKNEKFDVYIGRGSMFGNPYIEPYDGNREEVIEKFKIKFYKKMIKNERFLKELKKLKGKKLGCHCKPLKCHGDIIVEYLENND